MLHLALRKNSRIFILVFAAVIAFSGVSKSSYLEEELLTSNVDRNLKTEDDANFTDDQDADVFIAEIFPVGVGNFEQIFHPLTRYKKAVLGLDAEIEPMSNSQLQDHKYLQSDVAVVDHTRIQSNPIPESLSADKSREFFIMNPLQSSATRKINSRTFANNTSKSSYQDGFYNSVLKNYSNSDSDALRLFQKYPLHHEILAGNGRQLVEHSLISKDEDQVGDSSGSGIGEGSGAQLRTEEHNLSRGDQYKITKVGSSSRKIKNGLLHLQQGDLALQKYTEKRKTEKLNKTLSKNDFAPTRGSISNDSRYSSLRKVSTISEHDKTDKLDSNIISRVNGKKGKKLQGSYIENVDADEYSKNATYISQHEASDMRVVHKLENNAVFAPVDSRFKQHGDVNGQPVNKNNELREHNNDGVYSGEGSGAGNSIDGEESGMEFSGKEDLEDPEVNRDNQAWGHGVSKNDSWNVNMEAGGATMIGKEYASKALDNTPCFSQKANCNFAALLVNQSDWASQRRVSMLPQINKQVAKWMNTSDNFTGSSRYQEDIAERYKGVIRNGEEKPEKGNIKSIKSYASDETGNATISSVSNIVDKEDEKAGNSSNHTRIDNEHDMKTNDIEASKSFGDRDEEMLKDNDSESDTEKNSAKSETWIESNKANSSIGKKSDDLRKSPALNAPESEDMKFGLSRGEAVRQLFLSSLSRKEEEEQANKEDRTKNRLHEPDKNRDSQMQDGRTGGNMPARVSVETNHLRSTQRDVSVEKGYSNNKTEESEKNFQSLARKKLKAAKKLRNSKENLLKRHKSSKHHKKHKNIQKNNRYKIIHASKYGKEKSETIKEANRGNVNFITMMMSAKARELYKNLIHDTSKALMSRKLHQKKRSKHHFARMKLNQFADDKELQNTLNGIEENHKHYFKHAKNGLKMPKGSSARFPETQTLTTRLLNTMTENSHHLVEQTQFSPLRTSEKFDIKHSMREQLDTPNSLIEKLAELKYSKNDRMKEEEVPIPEVENAEDTSATAPEVDNENPGKTVLQRQSKVGLGADIDMESLDGRKQEYEFKSLDAKIEGELARNQMMNENDKETSIGQINSNQTDKDYRNITESAMKAMPIPSSLNVYNAEEVLGSDPELYQYGSNFNTTEGSNRNKEISERKVNQTMNLHRNVPNQEQKIGHTTPSNFVKKKTKSKKSQRRPTMYFSGNSSLWKHHPFVSMDIRPLVDVFYKVNHKNLIDLVREEEKEGVNGKRRNNAGHASQRKKPRRKKIIAEKALEHHKNRKRKNQKKRKQKLKKADSYIHAYKNRKSAQTVKKGKSINELISLFRNFANRIKGGKSYSKMDGNKLQQKYKHKKKKHVKASVKFGISETEKQANPPEIPEIKNNMPDQVKYYKIENAPRYGAVCIDGSTPGYYFRKGKGQDINKWIIHLHGGAWCYDAESCFRRSFSILGSTNNWSAENITNFFQGILSSNKDVNPWLSDWNVVVQSYCDGGLFSGRRKKPFVYRGRKMYFRGRQILKAMVDSLKRRNLLNASDIVLSGTSAGGLAILLQGDYIRHKLPKTASVRGLVDAGYFLDSEAEDGSHIIGNQFRGLYELHHPKLRKGCERVQDNRTRFLCLFPQHTAEGIKLPIYFVNALYDHWQLSELQRVRCVYHNDQCMTSERDRILNFRKVMYSRLNDAIAHLPKAGLFANSCIGHGQAIVDYTWSRIRVDNSSLREAFNDWLRDTNFEKRHLNIDCHFPCNGSCPRAMVDSCIRNFKGASSNHRTRRNAELC